LLAVRPGVGLVVCTTAPGHAQVIALELDRSPLAGVIGTVGGDDTVFVAVNHSERVASLADELRSLGGLDVSDEVIAMSRGGDA
jgi:transcriptional regulator of arginine metabolism